MPDFPLLMIDFDRDRSLTVNSLAEYHQAVYDGFVSAGTPPAGPAKFKVVHEDDLAPVSVTASEAKTTAEAAKVKADAAKAEQDTGRLSASELSATYARYKVPGRNALTGFIHLDAYAPAGHTLGDGTLHPLSEFFGTLAAAQAAYPDAGVIALTESVDRVAMVQAQAVAAPYGLAIQQREGTFITEKPWVCRAGVSVVGSVLTGYFPAVNFNDTQTVGTTWKLADNSWCDIITSDPNAPDAPYVQTPQHKWQRSSLLNLRLDGNRKTNYGPAAYDTANLRLSNCWNVYLENVYSYSAGGNGILLDDVNCVFGKSVVAYSCNRSDIRFKDSADSEFVATQAGGARGSAVVLDNCIGVNITGGILFNAEKGSGVLTADITDTQTTGITINGSATSTTLTLEVDRTPRYWLQVGSEIISYTGFTGSGASARTLTGVTRGVNGTTAAAHLTGDRIEDYCDGLNAGVALINGTQGCNVNGVRTDQTTGPGVYIDATSEGNTVHVNQFWAGWGAGANVAGIQVYGVGNTIVGATHKRTPTEKDHQTVGVYLGANAIDNLVLVANDSDFNPSMQYGSESARYRNTVMSGRRDKAVNASDAAPLVSGRYMATGPATTTATLAANTEYTMPLVISSAGTVGTMGVEVTGAGDGSSVVRFVIRDDDGTGFYPSAAAPLYHGSTASTSTGNKSVSPNLALRPGIYWVSLIAQGATSVQPTVRVSSRQRPRVLTNTLAGATGGTNNAYTQSGVTGTPSGFSGAVNTSPIDPLIAVKAA